MNQKPILILASIAAIILNGGLRVLNFSLSPTGRVLDSLIFVIWVIQIALFILLILVFVSRSTQGADISDRWQTIFITAALFAVFGLISIPIGNRIARPIQQRGYEAFVEENQFLAQAIADFENDNGSAPESLEALYPDYLGPTIAQMVEDQVGDETRSQIQLDVPYESLDDKSAADVLYSYKPPTANDPWQLQVSIYLGSFQSTRFVYNPDETYSNRYQPIKNWGID